MPGEDIYPYNIPLSFQYQLVFDGNSSASSGGEYCFHEISGLNVKMSPEIFTEGGNNGYTYKLPSKITYENLILKRGLLKGSALIAWVNDALFNFKFKPKNIVVSLMDESQNPVISWSVVGAYPVSMQISKFNAQENSVVVETFELAYSYFQQIAN